MKKQIKLTALLLTAILTLLSAASCGKSETEKEQKNSSIPENYVKIVDSGKTSYKIVRSDTSSIGASAAARMRAVLEKVCDDKVVLMNDFENEKLGTMRIDTEILVGPTNREESSVHEREFTYLDYAIDMDTTRLSITGGSSEALVMAAEYIGEKYIFEKEKALALPKGTVYEYYHDYPLDKLTIGGRNFEDYVIVTGASDTRGTELANKFLPLYGKTARAEKPHYENPSDCEIILSSAGDERYAEIFESFGDFDYGYIIEGTKVYIGTKGEISDELAWDMFIKDIFGEDFSLLSGDLIIDDCKNVASVPHSERLCATQEFLAETDAKADKLKAEITGSANITLPGNSTVYYVSENGSDSNDGKTPETAWKSLNPVNNTNFPQNTYILFERGGIWRGQIKAKAGVTYSAYGEGAKPALYGGHEDGANPDKWTLMAGTDNIWIYADEMIDSGTLVFNHGENVAYKEIPSYIDGKFVKRNAPTEEFDIIEALDVDLDFFHAADSVLTNDKYPTSGTATGEIYLRCDAGNPGEVFESIEFVPRRNGFALQGDNITIDNFTIKYIGAHGIGGGSREGLTVTNCEIGWIGGGIQSYAANGDTNQTATRFGNGIEIYVSCKDFTVDHCYIYEVYDAGITHQFKGDAGKIVKQENVTYSNNLIENCVYSIEYFLDASEEPAQSMYNIKMHDNIMRFCGFGWGNQRPNKGSQAHIKGWDHHNPAVDFEIYNNIMDRSTNWIIHCGYQKKEFEPKIYGNTFIQYSNGLFGKYDLIPTPTIAYGNVMLSDERLIDNKFYFIDNQYVKGYAGDKGTLSLKYNGMALYEDGEYIERHGEKITDAVQIDKITKALEKAEYVAAILGGYTVKTDAEKVDFGGNTYSPIDDCKTADELKTLITAAFDTPSAVKLTEKVNKYFKENNGKLYRLENPDAQLYYNNASWEAEECYTTVDGSVNVLVHIMPNDIITSDRRVFYKATADENGEYKFTESFAAPIELATVFPAFE